MRAWVSKETVVDGRRKYAKCERGTKGVGDGDRFRVNFIDPSGKRRAENIQITGKPGKRAADRRADQVVAEILAGTFEAKNRAKWVEFRNDYESKVLYRLESSTQIEVRNAMNHFEALVKPNRVATIETNVIDAFSAARSEQPGKKPGSKVAAYTIRKELGHLRTVLNVAVDWGLLAKAPKFRMPRVLQEEPPAVTEEHFQAIYGACDVATMPMELPCDPATWWRGLITFAITTGWRIGEILSFPTADLDLATGEIIVRAKNAKGKRDGRDWLRAETLEHIQAILEPAPADGAVIPIKTDQPSFVFWWPHHRRTLDVEFHRIQRAAGIHLDCHHDHEHTKTCHVYGFHGFRYAYATENVDRMSLPVLQRKMRHASRDTTIRYVATAEKRKRGVEDVYVPPFLRKTGTNEPDS